MITGIYKKGELTQSIKFITHLTEMGNIVLEGLKKDSTNPKLNRLSIGLSEIAFYVSYLERALANIEIDNQTKTMRILELIEENKELFKLKQKYDTTD